MTKGTRSLGRALIALAVPVFAAAIAGACGGGISTGGTGNTTSTGATTTGSASTGDGGHSGTTTGTAGGGSGTGGAGGMAAPKCAADADCVGDPKGPVCDLASGACVPCTPTNDVCAMGQYCEPATNTCKVGCTDATDCTGGGMALFCDITTNTCVGCLVDTDCPIGSICFPSNNVCVPGCSPTQACPMPETCCGATCFDLSNNTNHCGDCSKKCDPLDHAAITCIASMCGMGACDMGYADCDGNSQNGCEQNTLQDGPCLCAPGSTQGCYQGGPNTQNVGPCKGGTQTCDAMGTAWGPCMGQVLPKPELCANGLDEDCDGTIDNVVDVDGDGWTTCNGDCCDVAGPNCGSPALVNPGAFEVLNNGVDDDCDPASSDVVAPVACSTVQKFSSVTGDDTAKAMDLCQTTTANPPLPLKKWGLINASQRLANGTVPGATDLSNIQNYQNAILQNYGTGGIIPHKGATMAGISTGRMRDANDPGFVVPVTGTGYTSSISFGPPAPGAPLGTYTAAHGNGLLPGKCGNNPCAVGTGAQDSVAIRLQIRVPTNAQSFSYDFRFFSGEYQVFQCTAYNDYYLAMLTSTAPGIPVNHNISFDSLNSPVSVNNGFFQVCTPNGKGCGGCPNGAGELQGTGMDQVSGGGTAWLTTDAPITPGETMILELLVFDVTDNIYDSLVLLDNFRWNLAIAMVGTHT